METNEGEFSKTSFIMFGVEMVNERLDYCILCKSVWVGYFNLRHTLCCSLAVLITVTYLFVVLQFCVCCCFQCYVVNSFSII